MEESSFMRSIVLSHNSSIGDTKIASARLISLSLCVSISLSRLLPPFLQISRSSQSRWASLAMDATKLLSGSTVMFRPPIPRVRPTSAASTSGFLPPPPEMPSSSSFRERSLTDRIISTAASGHRRKLALKCGAVGGGIAEIEETQFADLVLKSERPVLVEFVANWCGPCRLISPAIEWVAQEYKERLAVVKIDHDASPKLIEKYKVYGLPTLIVFKNGEEVPESRREGAITKVKLKEYLDALLDSITVS